MIRFEIIRFLRCVGIGAGRSPKIPTHRAPQPETSLPASVIEAFGASGSVGDSVSGGSYWKFCADEHNWKITGVQNSQNLENRC